MNSKSDTMKTNLKVCIIGRYSEEEGVPQLLRHEFPDFQIVFKTNNLEEGLLQMDHIPIDILFVGIQLVAEKHSDILVRLKKKTAQIIFVTNSEQSAVRAIKKGIANWLIRPLKTLDFVLAVNKAVENFGKDNQKHSKDISLSQKISLPTLNGFKRINIHDIIRCEADSNYTLIYFSDHTKTIASKTLSDFEKCFANYHFLRIHHKYLINPNHIKEYIKGRGGQVVMSDNSVLDVSARRKNDFLKKML